MNDEPSERVFGPPGARLRLLASVADRNEARAALAGGAEIVDAKDPRRGALGALPFDTSAAILSELQARCETSVVAGEGPWDAATLAATIERLRPLEPTYLKIGFHRDDPGLQPAAANQRRFPVFERRIDELARPALPVAVFFADEWPDEQDALLSLVDAAASAGFRIAMIDTSDKHGPGLRGAWNDERIARFVDSVHRAGLHCGLAGSLRADDIAPLAEMGPDLLGFRGALCASGDRTGGIDPMRVSALHTTLSRVDRERRRSPLTADKAPR